MGKDFLKYDTNPKWLCRIILIGGTVITICLAILAYQESKLSDDNGLLKNEAGEGSYEQELVAIIKDQKIPLKVNVEEKSLTRSEAEAELNRASVLLNEILKGNNRDLENISEPVRFADVVPETAVEVEWTDKASDYFYSDGTLRETLEITESIEIKVSAILNCQEYTRDYEAFMILSPKEISDEKRLIEAIQKNAEENKRNDILPLPEEYEGNAVLWRKPLDDTFLYVFLLTIAATVFLKAGGKKDEQDKKRKLLEAYEKDYAQIVSKFTMLLSAGLSVRNAWERIVLLYRGKPEENSPILLEMNKSYCEMQKGVSELETYEKFGIRVGQIHYKKLMALFISDKKRGSINLLDAMNQEMLQAWEEQKRRAKQQGEKIGTKLLLPMMGMLAVVFIMIMVPAFLSFQI